MKSYSLTHLADQTLLRELAALVSQDRATTAALLAHVAEVDERKLYLPAAYTSMYAYCVHELHMSEDTAFKRIRAARVAREFPAIFAALEDGRLHLSAVVLLAPYLKPENADELLTAAAHKTKAGVERLLSERFPQPDLPMLVRPIAPAAVTAARDTRAVDEPAPQLAPGPAVPSSALFAMGSMVPLAKELESRARFAPLAPGRFPLQVTVNERTHDLLRYVQALLGHVLPSGDVAEVLERALESLVEKLEKQKFAARSRSRPRRGDAKGRYVPAEIRRAVWQRDGGQCTFVSESGKRCEERMRLELDHVDPVARDGQSTVENLRLTCRPHNQYAAECTFGAGFMREKREQARDSTRVKVQANSAAPEAAVDPLDVIPWLRQLGSSVTEARRGAALCAHLPDSSLEERLKVALRGLAPAHARRPARSAECGT